MKDDETNALFTYAFYNGLGKFTFERVIELEFKDAKYCFEYLKTLEIKVKVRSEEMKQSPGNPQGNYGQLKNNYNQGQTYGCKHCKLHKQCNHTTEECTKYDKDFYKKTEKNQKEECNYLIKEKINLPDRTAIKGKNNKNSIELRLDCGASRSFI
ncbi:hypothetical protein NGRA_3291 [Nosema granulosis]|uniref:Uncharacterized protein n=1 Tax=Nosema granulosis TaxID=83296 RepID=A0A9P6GW27_9MICR|nr:hypothetical protein NGRA_3291 [Nosema granulosis]